MQQFECTECLAHFYDDDLRLVRHKGEPPYTVCPECGSDTYEEWEEEELDLDQEGPLQEEYIHPLNKA